MVFAVVLFVLGLTAAGAALAHGDAACLMANPRYVVRDGPLLRPSDCRCEFATKFRQTPPGIEIVTGAGNFGLMSRALVKRGLYP